MPPPRRPHPQGRYPHGPQYGEIPEKNRIPTRSRDTASHRLSPRTAPAPGGGGGGRRPGGVGVTGIALRSRDRGDAPPQSLTASRAQFLSEHRTPRQPHSETLWVSRTPVLRTVVPPMVINDACPKGRRSSSTKGASLPRSTVPGFSLDLGLLKCFTQPTLPPPTPAARNPCTYMSLPHRPPPRQSPVPAVPTLMIDPLKYRYQR